VTTPERWLPVLGYEGLYEVSDLGRVKSFHRRKVRFMTIHYNVESGYAYVVLSRNGNSRHCYVHTLVLEAFDRPCPEGMECRHEDGDRVNARLSNLSWGTGSENNLDQVRHGTHNNASKEKCKKGHEYTEENTYYYRRADGSIKQRACKRCRADWSAQYRKNQHRAA
jgi:hypothetical protein